VADPLSAARRLLEGDPGKLVEFARSLGDRTLTELDTVIRAEKYQRHVAREASRATHPPTPSCMECMTPEAHRHELTCPVLIRSGFWSLENASPETRRAGLFVLERAELAGWRPDQGERATMAAVERDLARYDEQRKRAAAEGMREVRGSLRFESPRSVDEAIRRELGRG
jgi:hypothetical protein